MKQVIQHFRSGILSVEEVPETICRPGGILVDNVASLISAGTEKMAIDLAQRSLIGKARERPDLVRQVMRKLQREGLASTLQTVRARLETPIALGYSCAGVVREVGRGAGEFQVGDRVACAGFNHASHAETVFVPRNLAVRIPERLEFDRAAFVTLGAIALQGVRTSEAKLGEWAAVIGLGLIGQLTIQILKAAGCRVIGIDLDPAKVEQAKALGADQTLLRNDDVIDAVARATGGRGVDAIVITAAAESNDPVELAAGIARDRAIVSVVGAVGLNIPRKPYFEKELQLRISRSYGPGRYDASYEEDGIDYPIGYVRWTERRNMEEFLRLAANGSIDLERLISHRYPIDEAERAYDIVTGKRRESHLGIILQYEREARAPSGDRSIRLFSGASASRGEGRVRTGMIGAGNFAKSVLLPRIAANGNAELIGIATATGRNAKAIGTQFGFSLCTTDYRDLLTSAEIGTIFIATRHDTHARITAEALRAGKKVFVEKPLAIDEAGLEEVGVAISQTGGALMVGFNRRFSALSRSLRDFMRDVGPLAITYRVNAGAVPRESWIQGEEGGGRILGECCHFIDLIQFLTGAEPVEIYALTHPAGNDTVSITVRMSDGSIANINYFANGDRGLPKERIELFGAGRSAILDDFRTLELWRDGKARKIRRLSQEKGFDCEINEFLAAARSGAEMPIPWRSLALTTRATLCAEESIRTGQPVGVSPELP